jgi:hypothetical protein
MLPHSVVILIAFIFSLYPIKGYFQVFSAFRISSQWTLLPGRRIRSFCLNDSERTEFVTRTHNPQPHAEQNLLSSLVEKQQVAIGCQPEKAPHFPSLSPNRDLLFSPHAG